MVGNRGYHHIRRIRSVGVQGFRIRSDHYAGVCGHTPDHIGPVPSLEETMTDYDGPERRQGYEELAKRLDEHADHIAARFSKWFRAGLVAFAVMALGCGAALIGFAYALHEIQAQRRDVCETQNDRHDAVVRQFAIETTRLIKQQPDQAQRIRSNTAANLRLINALAPKVDCEKRVQDPP